MFDLFYLFLSLQNYNSKLSDFGLAKLGPSASKSHVTTRVMGTYGYAAPEYVATGNSRMLISDILLMLDVEPSCLNFRLTSFSICLTGHLYVKSDVYGFGVVLVEILTGLRAVDTTRPGAQQNLTEWIKPHLSDRRKLKGIMDSRLEGRYPSKAAFQVAQLALKCLETEPRHRPSMAVVVETLERIAASNQRPVDARTRPTQSVTRQHMAQPLHHRSPLHLRPDGGQNSPLVR